MCICLYGGVCPWVLVPIQARRGYWITKGGVMDSCESSDWILGTKLCPLQGSMPS